MPLTISLSKGATAIKHDVRISAEKNVDPALTYRNEIMIDRLKEFDYDLNRYTDARFQDYIDEHNKKVSRPCRRIVKGYSQILEETNKKRAAHKAGPRPTQIAYEFVLQVGNSNNNSASADRNEADIDINRRLFLEVLDRIQKLYPHAEILLATFHADEPEGTPHLHILVQFVGEGYTRGLSHQISVSRALECDGIGRAEHRKDDRFPMDIWISDIKDNVIEPLMKSIMHEDREIIGDSRPHLTPAEFRKQTREEKIYMDKERANYQADIKSMQQQEAAIDDIIIKKTNQLYQTDAAIHQKKQELNDKTSEVDALDADIKRKKGQRDTFKRLDNINSMIEAIEKRNEKTPKHPNDMIVNIIPEKKSTLTGKVKSPKQVTLSLKDFNSMKQQLKDQTFIIHLIQEAKTLLQTIETELKQLVAGKDSQERIEAMAKASEIVKEKETEMQMNTAEWEKQYSELSDAMSDVVTVLQIERSAHQEVQSPNTWDEYLQAQYKRNDCIPEDTFDDMLRDIEYYHDNDKDSFKDMMQITEDFKDTIDTSLVNIENNLLQERLRLMQDALEEIKKKERKKNHQKRYDEYNR